MSTVAGKPNKRIAFVLNALTGKELTGGNRDVARIYTLLTDPELGMCANDISKPIHQCKTRNEFLDHFCSVLKQVSTNEQLIFYFSGHGEIRRSKYCLKFGSSEVDTLPFDNLMNDLEANGINRAIIILDACHSGAAFGIKNSEEISSVINRFEIPKGIAILASSRATEFSRELADGSSSVFTDLLCKGIETGLDGESTSDGLITVGDIIAYIRKKLESDEKYRSFSQRPVFGINNAERDIWVAKNRSGVARSSTQNDKGAPISVKSFDELKFLYEKTLPELHPCADAVSEDIDWDLVKTYSEKIKPGLWEKSSRDNLLDELKFYSSIPHEGKKTLHKSAVLCFHKNPEVYYSQAKSTFVVGYPRDPNFIREDVAGPLRYQVEGLLARIEKHIEKVSYIAKDGLRSEKPEIDLLVVRELISNAITHRDYNINGNVTVTINPEAIEIRSPGRFPPNTSWEAFIKSPGPVSCPVNAAISQYLANLLAFEGIGRGFDIFKEYIEENDAESIVCFELPGPTTLVRLARREKIAPKFVEAQNVEALRNSYLNVLYETTAGITLSGVDPKAANDVEGARIHLDAVYVALMTLTRDSHEPSQQDNLLRSATSRLSALEQLNRHGRLMLLGDPGSGKSTFVNFVTLCLAGENLNKANANLAKLTVSLTDLENKETEKPQSWNHGNLIPVRIIMRDFAARTLLEIGKKVSAEHLWHFLIDELKTHNLEDYAPFLRRELLEKGGLILMDGLDEVPEAQQRRRQIKEAIEDFAAAFPKCRILVTGRTYAYQKQDWRLASFNEAVLAPFLPHQINDFIQRWYVHIAAMSRMNIEDASGRAELLKRAISSSNRLQALAEKPLLLTLMVSLHSWRGGSLPEKREQLYADIVDLLLDWWERPKVVREKEGKVVVIQPSLAEWLKVDRQKVRDVLNELAYQAHKDQIILTGAADIKESDLIAGMMRISYNPDVNPVRLLEYLSQRAGLLLPRASGIFTFPHRTFQEYLAACYLVDHDFPEMLAELVHQDPNRWREVALLAASKAARGSASTIWSFAETLCYLEVSNKENNLEHSWSAHIAGQALLENINLTKVSERNKIKLERIKSWLVNFIRQVQVPAVERAIAGKNLAFLGDPRPEAMTINGMQFCYVPSGPFLMGSDKDELSSDNEKPQHLQENSNKEYLISRYPVTSAQFSEFITAGGYKKASYWSEAAEADIWKAGKIFGINDNSSREFPVNYEELFNLPNHPVIGITWYEALAFTRWLTERWRHEGRLPENYVVALPSEMEWEKAARGGLHLPDSPVISTVDINIFKKQAIDIAKLTQNSLPSRIFPYGNEFDAERGNCSVTNIGSTSAIGCFPSGSSPYGCEDMSGNVNEWTRSIHMKYPYNPNNTRESRQHVGKVRWVIRGGSCEDDIRNVRVTFRSKLDPSILSHNCGFRLVISSVL